MSYLKHLTYKRKAGLGIIPADVFGLQWRSVSGTVYVNKADGADTMHVGLTVYYTRHSKLGGLLRLNNESERVFIAQALRMHYAQAEPMSLAEARTVSFVGV
jgi:hypothetical protein